MIVVSFIIDGKCTSSIFRESVNDDVSRENNGMLSEITPR